MSPIRVRTFSRRSIQRVKVHKPSRSAWIGITNPGKVLPSVDLKQFAGHIGLEFTDIKTVSSNDKGINEAQANEVATFIVNMISKGVNTFYINCEGGLSRSVGVAMAIERHFNNITYDKYSGYNYNVFNKVLGALKRMLEATP